MQVLVLAALVTLAGGYLAWHLKLRTAFSELLPSKDPGVIALTNTSKRMGVMSLLLNFIALPITFGIGAEYALNVLTRYREDRNIVHAVLSTAAAVALCSWTTIVGYGSLLAARNQALNGFGWMAILGEVSCLMAAIVALPAALLWWRKRAARGGDRRSATG